MIIGNSLNIPDFSHLQLDFSNENHRNIYNLIMQCGKDGFLQLVNMGAVSGASFISKFGENPDIDTGSPADIWEGTGKYTYSTSADIDTISSSSTSDNVDLTIYGLDSDWNEISETITLNGRNKVTLNNNYLRVYRIINIDSSDLVGNVYCYVNTDITNGVPNDSTKIRALIKNGNNQTLMTHYSIPAGKTGYGLGGFISISRSITSVAVMSWKLRPFGGVFNVVGRTSISSSASSHFTHNYFFPIPMLEKSDFKFTIESVTANNTAVSGAYDLLLIDN